MLGIKRGGRGPVIETGPAIGDMVRNQWGYVGQERGLSRTGGKWDSGRKDLNIANKTKQGEIR